MVAPAPLAAPTRIVATIPGVPVAWARARTGNGAHFTASKQRAWKDFAAYYLLQARAGFSKFGGPVVIAIDAYWPRPKRTPVEFGTARYPRLGRPDLDNAIKNVCDAAIGVLFQDDAQVVALTASKWVAAFGEGPRTEVVVEAWRQS